MKDKITILYVVEAMAGGVFTYLTELIEGIEDDFEIVIAMSKRPNTPKDYRKYFSDKVRIIEMKNMSRHLSIGGVLKRAGRKPGFAKNAIFNLHHFSDLASRKRRIFRTFAVSC